MTERARTSMALLSGAVTWLVTAWILSRFIVVPIGAVVFWGTLMATLALLGFLVPVHGFQGGALKAGVALALSMWVALGPMGTPLRPLIAGVTIVGLCFLVAVGVVGMVVTTMRPPSEPRSGSP